MRLLLPFLSLLVGTTLTRAEEYSAAELVAAVQQARPSGQTYTRLRLEHRSRDGAESQVLQVQLKRRSLGQRRSEQLYQVLYPAEQKGAGLLLKVDAGSFTGTLRDAGGGRTPLVPEASDQNIFGTLLTIEDLLSDFLFWPSPRDAGTEELEGVACRVVEWISPAEAPSTASRIRAWIDEERYVTRKIEWLDEGGAVIKRSTTGRAAKGSNGYYLPIQFTVEDPTSGASTTVEGVRSISDVPYRDPDFTDSALDELSGPPR